LFPILRHRITARGVQPLLRAQYRREYVYVYGAVAPLTGRSFFLELPTLDSQGFQLFLDHFAAADRQSFHLLLLDNAPFHSTPQLRIPPNVGFLFLPPYAPELNPIERLWRDLKDWLARYAPKTLHALSDLLCTRLSEYTAPKCQSLTGFSYVLAAARAINGQSS
jgi:transposase